MWLTWVFPAFVHSHAAKVVVQQNLILGRCGDLKRGGRVPIRSIPHVHMNSAAGSAEFFMLRGRLAESAPQVRIFKFFPFDFSVPSNLCATASISTLQ